MKRVLFVDDEQNILDGLRNLLRKQRKQWQMSFALGGEAAIKELEAATFDVVVSDIRMPGMDGVSLLERVKAQYPTCARIVLSGYADREVILRAVTVAHQFLSKPCDVDVLRGVVQRVLEVQLLVQNDELRGVTRALETLPSAARSRSEITRALSQPDVTIAEVADAVERDPAMSVKVLQLVNSAYFGQATHTSSIRQATLLLGTEVLRSLTPTAQAFGTFEHHSGDSPFDDARRHAILTARVARRLCDQRVDADQVFAAALLHDIGALILVVGTPEKYDRAFRTARTEQRPLHLVEREAFGATHADIGAYLLGTWGLPSPVVESVAHHHEPSRAGNAPVDVLAIVHVASALVDAATHEPGASADLDEAFLDATGYTGKLPEWRAIAAAEMDAFGRELQEWEP